MATPEPADRQGPNQDQERAELSTATSTATDGYQSAEEPAPADQLAELAGRRAACCGAGAAGPHCCCAPVMKAARSLSMVGPGARQAAQCEHQHPQQHQQHPHQEHQRHQQHPNQHPNQQAQLRPDCQLGVCAHRLHSQYSMPSSLNHRRLTAGQQYVVGQVDESIVRCQLSIAAKKDFNEEVRALLDVRKFVADSFILTDIGEVRISAIVDNIVDRLVDCRGLPDEVADEARSLLYVDPGSLNMMLANTMQGLYKSRTDGRLAYDNSWLIAVANMSSLHKRQMAIARFPQPVNFGRQSQEVRFLIIILASSREKMTKNAWETGRTFATMFTDINFRRRMLRAKSQDELKMELLAKAEFLARQTESDQFHTPQLIFSSQPALGAAHKCALGDSAGTPVAAAAAGSRPPAAKARSRALACCGGGFGPLGSGLADDFRRRAGFYLSDYTDGLFGERSLYKTIATTVFLYFSVLLPCIAFGVVDTHNTDGQIDPKKTMMGQALGGLLFAVLSGQPLVVIMTTAPLCIYIKVIYQISQDLEVDFGAFYSCVGLWMSLFLVAMSLSNVSNLMKRCTRSTEDIFALFTAFAFGSDGVKEAIRSFNKYYWEPECSAHGTVLTARTLPETAAQQRAVETLANAYSSRPSHANATAGLLSARNLTSQLQNAIQSAAYTMSPLSLRSLEPSSGAPQLPGGRQPPAALAGPAAGAHSGDLLLHHSELGSTSRCQREVCILFLCLMCGTLWLANSFSYFDRTPYLSSRKREIIKDYALAISVLIFSFVGSYLFADIRLDVFEFGDYSGLQVAHIAGQLSWTVLAASCLLGFMLSVLFYIDQNICGAMVNNAPYKLKKGDYFHLDLLVIALINAFLSLTGLPWMHGKLPHSHLHSKALADYEERVDDGHVHQTIVNVRETRLTGLLCSLLVGLSLLATPYPISYIPLPVLSGVFLYTALAEFKSNSMVERVCLLFTEQAAYPPNHYIRRCPQRKIHLFTLAQILQLAVVTLVGFYPNPYVNMAFPLVVATFVPIRDKLLPHLINAKHLDSLDAASSE